MQNPSLLEKKISVIQQLNNLTIPSYYSSVSPFWLSCSTSLFCFRSLPFREKKKATSKHAKINETHMWDTVIIPCLYEDQVLLNGLT